MRTLALIFAVSLGAVLLGSAIHAESTVPFQATIDTTPAPVGFCGPTCLELTIPGTGTASHMGSVDLVGLTQIDVATLGQQGLRTRPSAAPGPQQAEPDGSRASAEAGLTTAPPAAPSGSCSSMAR